MSNIKENLCHDPCILENGATLCDPLTGDMILFQETHDGLFVARNLLNACYITSSSKPNMLMQFQDAKCLLQEALELGYVLGPKIKEQIIISPWDGLVN